MHDPPGPPVSLPRSDVAVHPHRKGSTLTPNFVLVVLASCQILDKSVIGYGSIFGLQKEAHLVGNQYSIIGSSGYWAQLGWQPFSAWLIVKVPTRYLMSVIVTAWGLSMVGLAFSTK